ncbi:PQQ-binding-like beta-propeller repeat protein [Couchioplanes caeruleus]|nr:PQQ-binding-like beta-propeller repeat protein [Couchioplanes caeruleus]
MRFASIARPAFPRRRHLGILLAGALVAAGIPTAAVAATPLVSVRPTGSVGFDGLVYATAYAGNTVFVGGSFRNAIVDGRSVPRKRLAALNARTGELLPWAPATNGTVWGLTAFGQSLYITGKFTTVGDQARGGLANINLRTGAVGTLRHTVKGEGHALAAGGGRLFLGGAISAVDGRARRNLAAFDLTSGALETFGSGADGEVKTLTVAGSRLYVGGGFKRLNGADGTARLAALRLTDGRVDTTFRPVTPYAVGALTVAPDKVYAALAGPGGRVAAYRPDGQLVWSTVTDGDVQAITHLGGSVYAGGHFTVACPGPSRTATSWCPATLRSQPKLAALNAANGKLLDWNPKSNGKWGVLSMDVHPTLGRIAVGGEFTALGGLSRPHFAQFSTPCSYGCNGRSGSGTR